MVKQSNNHKISAGFAGWMQAEHRAASKEIEFGKWWRLDDSYWRVAWLEATNELYAVEAGKSDRFILLARLERKDVHTLMKNWFDGDNLSALLHRFGLAPL